MKEEAILWQAKLAARLHDPIEKALVLMRTDEGHEAGTSAILRDRLGLNALPGQVEEAVRRADRWASAADRAAFPNRDADGRFPAWQQVRFHEQPVVVHPLTGDEFRLDRLDGVEPAAAKALALDHLSRLIHEGDLRRTAMAFWRFGPELDASDIRNLWALLPADTRVPDHTIFDHLDLTAALAGCFAVDPEGGPCLMAVSLGPVQDFIASGRSTSDLWAGSHLLARLAWEAMRIICEELGPEAILFPRLRGVPQVDLWLRDGCGLRAELFERCSWTQRRSDSNPLFAAALPNRFTALVPANRAKSLAERITAHLRSWAIEKGQAALRAILDAAGIPDDPGLPAYGQISEQLAGFPEVHWATVPWSLVESDGDRAVAQQSRLAAAMQPFFSEQPPGYLATNSWRLLSGGLELEAGWFWHPNPGALYPALFELLERLHAASKSARPFVQLRQQGWRDSASGEAEWLTTDRQQLLVPPGQRSGTLWTQLAAKRPGWARRGEHLGALNTLKRLWPTLFIRELGEQLGDRVDRFVVSTHTMALAGSLSRVVKQGLRMPPGLRDAIESSGSSRVALPPKLAATIERHPDSDALKRLPGWLEQVRESEDEAPNRLADDLLGSYLGRRPESYYGLALMDGDRMGAWLSGDRAMTLTHDRHFHPQIRAGLQTLRGDANFVRYAGERRAASPSRHMAISDALNHFALEVAPDIVERQYHGRILYAGGDDLMAMLPVIDLLPAMGMLRAAYSGQEPMALGVGAAASGSFQSQGNGFIRHRGRLMRMMGREATASCGAVIVHHQAPLASVLRELRAAEQRAKSEGGRDAFSLTVVKRSGGALRFTARWGESLRVLLDLRDFLALPGVSRRAVYNSLVWLSDLPDPEDSADLVTAMLGYQFARQAPGEPADSVHALASRVVSASAQARAPSSRTEWIAGLLSIAEFLARETRSPSAGSDECEEETAA